MLFIQPMAQLVSGETVSPRARAHYRAILQDATNEH